MINMVLEGSDKSQLWMRPLVTDFTREDKTMLWEKYGRLNTQYRIKVTQLCQTKQHYEYV